MNKNLKDFLIQSAAIIAGLALIVSITQTRKPTPPEVKPAFLETTITVESTTTIEETITVTRGTARSPEPPSHIHPKPAPTIATSEPQAILAYGEKRNNEVFGAGHWTALYNLWMAESEWIPSKVNPSSGACGIPQALPCNKITDHSYQGQIEWGLSYISQRYGNPINAYAHFKRNNWY